MSVTKIERMTSSDLMELFPDLLDLVDYEEERSVVRNDVFLSLTKPESPRAILEQIDDLDIPSGIDPAKDLRRQALELRHKGALNISCEIAGSANIPPPIEFQEVLPLYQRAPPKSKGDLRTRILRAKRARRYRESKAVQKKWRVQACFEALGAITKAVDSLGQNMPDIDSILEEMDTVSVEPEMFQQSYDGNSSGSESSCIGECASSS